MEGVMIQIQKKNLFFEKKICGFSLKLMLEFLLFTLVFLNFYLKTQTHTTSLYMQHFRLAKPEAALSKTSYKLTVTGWGTAQVMEHFQGPRCNPQYHRKKKNL
jgi:hypothetical protein